LKEYSINHYEIIDSNIPWLGNIPNNWKLHRLDKLFEIRKEDPLESDQRVTAYLDGRVTLRSNVKGQKIKGVVKEAGWQRIHRGDFAISGMNAHIGGMGVSDSLGKCSPIYLVLIPKLGFNVYFISHVVRYTAHIGALKNLVNTIRYNSADFKKDDLKKIWVWLPPLEEQNAIVRYLDYTDRRIKRYIRAKQKLIKLLEEEKQAIIYRTVTRGLNKEVRFKPSGIDWVDYIPENWEVLPGKTCFLERKTSNKGLIEQTVLSLSYGKIIVKPEEKLHGLVPTSFETYQIIDNNDIIVRPTDLQNDKVSLRFGLSTQRGIITSAYLCLKTKEKLFPQYGYLFLHCLDLNKIIYRLGSGLRQNLRWEDFKYLQILMPPLQEQLEICNFINSSNKKIEEQIHLLRTEISLLSEYRTRLIADVVTGKLDVREAAAELPEELEDDEEIEENDAEDEEELQEELDP